MTMIEIVPFLAPTTTVLVGCMVTYVAWQQWKVARNKLKLDLFDRRYKIYEAAQRFVDDIAIDGKFSQKKYLKFCSATSNAEFLFDRGIYTYLLKARQQATGLRYAQENLSSLPAGEERSHTVEIESEYLHWFSDQRMDISEVFKPYLSFARVW